MRDEEVLRQRFAKKELNEGMNQEREQNAHTTKNLEFIQSRGRLAHVPVRQIAQRSSNAGTCLHLLLTS
jgi:hypothetical protein